MKKKLILIAGPTAVGKTSVSIELAKKINGEIISADSVQVYRGLDIGSAKIKKEEMQGIEHYLIDIKEADEDFNVVIFKDLVKEAIDKIYEKGKIPILVGGTGFYLQAVLYDIDFLKQDDKKALELRRELEKEYEEKGADYMFEKLLSIDKEAAFYIHKNNAKRLIRAIEFALLNNEKISLHNKEQRKKESIYDSCFFVLSMDRKKLYSRIDERVELMFSEGLLKEFENLLDKGINKNNMSMQAIGYKELFLYKDGLCSLEEVKEKIKQNTRHFAKRQITWFKREKQINDIDVLSYKNVNEIVEFIISKINL